MNYLNQVLAYREKSLWKLLYWAARIGLAVTFIISGIRKFPGVKFTILPIENPVGFYFTAMHETGFYWNFIGYFQVLIGLFALSNRSVVLSVLLMMPITVNIFLISLSLNMTGTPIITSMMLLGNIFLLFWHYENYIFLLRKPMKRVF